MNIIMTEMSFTPCKSVHAFVPGNYYF